MPYAAVLAGLVIASALVAAPLNPAFADRDDRRIGARDDDQDARDIRRERSAHAKQAQAKEIQAKKAYRKRQAAYRAEAARREPLAARQRRAWARYDSPWGPFYGPPGL